MDGSKCSISDEDLVGVLRTIFLFLDNQNFKDTCDVLARECLNKGLDEVTDSTSKIIIIKECNGESKSYEDCCYRCCGSNREKPEDFPLRRDPSYILESSIYDLAEFNNQPKRCVCVYYADTANFADKLSRDDFYDKSSDSVIASVCRPCQTDTDFCRPREDGHKAIYNIPYNCIRPAGPKAYKQLKTLIKKGGKLVDKTTEYTERETVTDREADGSNMSENVADVREKSDKLSQSNGEIASQKATKSPPEFSQINQQLQRSENNYKELRNKFSLLQLEHQKLMSVTAELTQALQTNILGQSENLNSMLNNCKCIYPDLFVGGSETSCTPSTCKYPIKPEDKLTNLPNNDSNSRSTASSLKSESTRRCNLKTCSLKSNLPSDLQQRRTEMEQCDCEVNDSASDTVLVETSDAVNEPTNEINASTITQHIVKNKFSSKSADDLFNVNSSFEERTYSFPVSLGDSCVVKNENPTVVVTLATSEKPLDNSDAVFQRGANFELDYKKIKVDLISGDNDTKLRLLQALRWRITRATPEIRDNVVCDYVRNDLLGLRTGSSDFFNGSLVERYYCPQNIPTPNPLQESMARLVNTFASLTIGRNYLCQDDDFLLTLLLPVILETHKSKPKIDAVTRGMMLATLQKLSLRNQQRVDMISEGLVEYLIGFLSANHGTLTIYNLEYTTALLMNLCLHSEAKKRCRSMAKDVVNLLGDLINLQQSRCMPYLNGTMYSLLADSQINKEARNVDLEKLIKYHIQRTDGEIRKQLKYILKMHLESAETFHCGCDPNMEPEVEMDVLESELDDDDTVKTQPSGEELLKNYKLLSPLKNQMEPTCLCRPTTPTNTQASKQQTQANVSELVSVEISTVVVGMNGKESENVSSFVTSVEINSVEETIPEESKNTKISNDKSSSCSDLNTGKRTNNSNYKRRTEPNRKTENERHSLSDSITKYRQKFEKLSKDSSRSTSPDMSFSEENKQFYHKPSAAKGIFETEKKPLNEPPFSFTRTIAASNKNDYIPPIYCYCPNAKQRTVHNYNDLNSCHWENKVSECSCGNSNCRCNRSNKYACNCYEAMKTYVSKNNEIIATDNVIDQKNMNRYNDKSKHNSNHTTFKTQNSPTFTARIEMELSDFTTIVKAQEPTANGNTTSESSGVKISDRGSVQHYHFI